jgi:hypothetical protein
MVPVAVAPEADAIEGSSVLEEWCSTQAAKVSAFFKALGAKLKTAFSRPPTLMVDCSKVPELAENIYQAQKAGRPAVLTRSASGEANRAAALKGIPRIPGYIRDEYPFASTQQGGAGAWVGHVSIAGHRSQGAAIARFYADNAIAVGSRFRVKVINHP